MLMISRVTLSRAESIFIGLFGKRKTRNLLNISDSIWKNAIGKRERQIERERDERNIFMVELSPVPDLEGYKYENLLF